MTNHGTIYLYNKIPNTFEDLLKNFTKIRYKNLCTYHINLNSWRTYKL